MTIAGLERPSRLDELVQRGGERLRDELQRANDAAGSVAEQAEQAIADLGEEAGDLGSEMSTEVRRLASSAEARNGIVMFAAIVLTLTLFSLIVLARRRAAAVRQRATH